MVPPFQTTTGLAMIRYAKTVGPLPSTVPFVGPETQERQRGAKFLARIGANENVFGPSPKAIAAMREAAAECWMYCDPDNWDLRAAVAAEHGVSPGNVMIGEGIDSLFGYTVRMLVDPGDVVVTSLGAYPTFNFHVTGYGGHLVRVPYLGDHEDPGALLAAVKRDRPKAVFLANPDSPMGSWWPGETIQGLINDLPEDTALILDEAYVDFAPRGTAPAIDVTRPNVIRFRTFSKAYGMAGARIAYVLAEESVAKSYDKIRNHFAVNRIAQSGALAALADKPYLADTIARVARARGLISEVAAAQGLRALPSATNFQTIDCGRDGRFAKAVLEHLVGAGVFIRMPGVAPLDRCIRVSAGTDADIGHFARHLPAALDAAMRVAG